jgi:hypothetical protein
MSANSRNELADRLAIIELTSKYAHLFDTHQVDELLNLFAEDAIFDESNLGAGLGRLEGHDAIRAYFDSQNRAVAASFHLTGNHIIDEITDTGARGTCSVYCDALFKSGESIHVDAWYDDTYVRTADGWKFGSRIVRLYIDAAAAVAMASTAIASEA